MKKLSTKARNIRNLIVVPLICFAAVAAASLAIAAPAISDVSRFKNLITSEKQPDFKKLKNIYTPTDYEGETIDASKVDFPSVNTEFGELIIEGTGVDAKLYYGDGQAALRNGVGVYHGSFVPGYGKTVLVAGHNNTYFNGLKNVSKGDVVHIKTSWGNYKYKVNKIKIVDTGNEKAVKKAYDLNADKENLILYTCYPFDELGLTPQRFFVYADKISGPKIVGLYD